MDDERSKAFLERIRNVGLRVDFQGRLWHEDVLIEHPRLQKAIFRWMKVREDGRSIVQFHPTRYAYLDVDDAHMVVRSAAWDGENFVLSLPDGTSENLNPRTLSQTEKGVYCSVRNAQLVGRLSPQVFLRLCERLRDQPPELNIGGQWVPVPFR